MNKILLAAAASSMILLSGCASNMDSATSTKIDKLSTQISTLSDEVSSLKNEQMMLNNKLDQNTDAISAANKEAKRANMRIDNIAQSYTK